MRPAQAAVVLEVVGVGLGAELALARPLDAVHVAVALGVVHGLLLAVEEEAELLAGVAGGGPAHQRLDPAGLLRLELQHPALGVGAAGLGGRLGASVDAHLHGRSLGWLVSRSGGL